MRDAEICKNIIKILGRLRAITLDDLRSEDDSSLVEDCCDIDCDSISLIDSNDHPENDNLTH